MLDTIVTSQMSRTNDVPLNCASTRVTGEE